MVSLQRQLKFIKLLVNGKIPYSDVSCFWLAHSFGSSVVATISLVVDASTCHSNACNTFVSHFIQSIGIDISNLIDSVSFDRSLSLALVVISNYTHSIIFTFKSLRLHAIDWTSHSLWIRNELNVLDGDGSLSIYDIWQEVKSVTFDE